MGEFLDICREEIQGIKNAWEEVKDAGRDLKGSFCELISASNSETQNINEKDTSSEKPDQADTTEPSFVETEEQAEIIRKVKAFLEQAKENLQILNDVPDVFIESVSDYWTDILDVENPEKPDLLEKEALLKKFIDLHSIVTMRKYRIRDFNQNCENCITDIKKVYGAEIQTTLDHCAELIQYDDEIIQKMRCVILAVKIYPANLGYYCRHDIERLLEDIKKQNDFSFDMSVQSQINTLEEFIRLESYVFSGKISHKQRVDYTDPQSIVRDGEYIVKVIDGKASIIEYLGNSDDIMIPDTIVDIPVNAIDDYAFCGKQIKNVVLHSGITSVGIGAFYRSGLEKVIFSPGLVSIRENAFRSNKLTSLDLPETLTVIAEHAFELNKIITTNIPPGVSFISESVFAENKLTNVMISSGVTTIEFGAFKDNCLESVIIPDSVTMISSCAFTSNPLRMITLSANIELESGCCNGNDLTDAYDRNRKSAGVYKYDEGHWKRFLDAGQFTAFDIAIHEEMEELGIRQEEAIMKIEQSAEGFKLSRLQNYLRNPIPKEIWEQCRLILRNISERK